MLVLRNYKVLFIWDSTLSDLWIFEEVRRSHHLLLHLMNELRKIRTSVAFCVYTSFNFRLMNFVEKNIMLILCLFTNDERFLWVLSWITHIVFWLFPICTSNWFLSDLCYLTRKNPINGTPVFLYNPTNSDTSDWTFYHEIRCHVNPQIPTISWYQITLNHIGSEQILRSDLTGTDCMNMVGTWWIRSADIKEKRRIASESGNK